METKPCSKCKEIKPVDEFGHNPNIKSGYRSQCRSCASEYATEHYKKNRLEKNRLAREDRVKDPEKYREYSRQYYLRHRDRIRIKQREYAKKNRAAARCRQLFCDAIAAGKIKRPENCERCGAEYKVQGHHDDYSKPFKVLWLCLSCHTRHHMKPGRDTRVTCSQDSPTL